MTISLQFHSEWGKQRWTYDDLFVNNVRASEAVPIQEVRKHAGHDSGRSKNHEVTERGKAPV
jgi:hypothetical protein